MLLDTEMAVCLLTLSQTITDGLEVGKMIQKEDGMGLGHWDGMVDG